MPLGASPSARAWHTLRPCSVAGVDLQLQNRVIVVVGGTGLIGSAVVERLQREGAHAIAASRSGSGLNGIALDATDEQSVQREFDAVVAQHGRLDGVVMTAAASAGALDPSQSNVPARVAEAIDAKALSFLRVANAALPVMTAAGYGRIVAVSGQYAFQTGNAMLSVRNAALNVIAKNLADSVAGSGVTVNVINPGHVLRQPTNVVQHGRTGDSTPENSADLIAFLSSPIAGAISGESIAMGHRLRGTVSL